MSPAGAPNLVGVVGDGADTVGPVEGSSCCCGGAGAGGCLHAAAAATTANLASIPS